MIILYYAVEIAQRIKRLAKEKEITIKDMLVEIKLNKNSINTLSNGSMIQCDSLAKIADYLDCSVDYLLGRTSQVSYSADSFTLNPNERTILNTFNLLPLSKQENALDYLKYLLSSTTVTAQKVESNKPSLISKASRSYNDSSVMTHNIPESDKLNKIDDDNSNL